MKKVISPFFLSVIVVSLFAEGPGDSKTIVLEASKIEGKIKKPQVALISMEKRPVFKPIALTSLDTRKDITKAIDKNVFENKVYLKAFEVTAKKPD